MTKLEDLTDEELDNRFNLIEHINSKLCSGIYRVDNLFFLSHSVRHSVVEAFKNVGWIVQSTGSFVGALVFTSSLEKWSRQAPRDNHGTHSARYSSQTRVPESPPVS